MSSLDEIRQRAAAFEYADDGVYDPGQVLQMQYDIAELLGTIAAASPHLAAFYLNRDHAAVELRHTGCGDDHAEGGWIDTLWTPNVASIVAACLMHECAADPVDWWTHLPNELREVAIDEAAR